MSVLIKGMEMPKEDGALCIIIHHDGKVCHFFDLQGERIATAVPVPEHGRLIDADVLKPYMLNEHCRYRRVFDADEVANAPTIIPADPPIMYYPQVPGITPTVISDKEGEG